MHTSDIKTFATDNFPTQDPRAEWIDDTSANLVYSSSAASLEALLSFTLVSTTTEAVSKSPFELRNAKKSLTHPSSMLQVRIAKAGDRKKKGAKDASRYYLLHPDQDPRERMRKEFEATGRIRRGGGENGDYNRRRYDDREHRRRRDKDAANGGDTNGDFAASMYDDNPAPAVADSDSNAARGRDLFARTSGGLNRNRSASPGRSLTNSDSIDIDDDDEEDIQNRRKAHKSRFRDRSPPPRYTKRDPHPFPVTNASKELFPSSKTETTKTNGEGTLHSDKLEHFPSPSARETANKAAANRLKKDLLSSPRSQNHRRSNAMDANDADLSNRFARNSLSEHVQSRNAGKELLAGSSNGLNIRGSAAAADTGLSIKGSGGLSIKGAAANTRELFPSLYQKGGNEGKELFSDKIRNTGRRVTADDFH